MKFLITGFPAFPGREINPSRQLVEAVQRGELAVAGIEFRGEVLPCEYHGVERAFDQLTEEFQPDAMLCFGVGRQTAHLRLETRGVNLDHCELPDNAGDLRLNTPILSDGPHELFTPLELSKLVEQIRLDGIDVELGQDAGTYVCNHLLYHGLWNSLWRRQPPLFLFTHVCSFEDGFDLTRTLQAVKTMANWFARVSASPPTSPDSECQ